MRFINEYAFLSNMYECQITYSGITYRNVEAAFQAMKVKDINTRQHFATLSGKEAKALGKRVQLRPDWNNIRLGVMETMVRIKFQDTTLAAKLIAVQGPITEDNTWGDKFWGVCNGVGENNLGKILIKIREELTMDNTVVNNEVVIMEEVAIHTNTYVAPIIPENVMAGNNYKGQRTAVQLNGCVVKTWDKSQMKYNSFPKTRVPMVAHKFNKTGSEAYLEFCRANTPVSTAQAALDRIAADSTMNYSVALHKALWKTLFNCPQHLVLHANKTKNYVMSIIKFALTHGIDVTYFDEYSEKVWEFKAVANEFLNPLNQDFIVEDETERLELTKARNSVKDAMWRKVEAELAPMTNLAYVNKLEHNGEDYLYAQRATLKDIINSATLSGILDYTFTAERVMWDEDFQDMLLVAIRRYGKAYDLPPLVTTKFEFTNESFTVYDPNFTNNRPGYAGNEEDAYEAEILAEAIAKAGVEKEKPEISRFVFKANRERKMQAKRDVNWIDVVNQYIQIKYFELNGGLELFGLPEYQYCSVCGAPVHENSECCELCGTAPNSTELVYAGLFNDCIEVAVDKANYDICPLEDVSDDWNFMYKSNKPNLQVELTGEQYTIEEAMGIRAGFNAEDTRERLSKLNDVSPKTCGKEVSIHADEDWWLQQYSTIFNCKCREQSLSGWDIYKARHRK